MLVLAPLLTAILLRPGSSIGHRCRVRASTIACCDVPAPPAADDAAAVAEHAREAVRSAVVNGGLQHLRVEVSLPSLDPKEAHFDPVALAHVALQTMRALTVLDGELVLLLPSLQTLAAAEEAVAQAWPVADRERLRIALLEHVGEPAANQPPAAGVLIAGFVGDNVDEPSHRHACAWLRGTAVGICLNSHVRLLKFEQSRYETAFAIEPHTVSREVLRFRRAGGENYPHFSERLWVKAENPNEPPQPVRTLDTSDAVSVERLGRAMLYRAHPRPWQVRFAFGVKAFMGAAEVDFERLAELPARPNERELVEILEPTVKARRAALGAALRALRPSGGAEGAEGGGNAPREASVGPLSVAGGIGVAHVEQSGAVLCLSWDDIEAQGPEALSFYQAVTLLRQRCHGAATSFAKDEAGLHIFRPFSAEEARAARARSEAAGRLNGDLLGACLLVPDGASEGIATIEQLAFQRDAAPEERAECAAALLETALAECAARRQRYALVPPLPPLLSVDGAKWLQAAGFASADEAGGASCELIELARHLHLDGAMYIEV